MIVVVFKILLSISQFPFRSNFPGFVLVPLSMNVVSLEMFVPNLTFSLPSSFRNDPFKIRFVTLNVPPGGIMNVKFEVLTNKVSKSISSNVIKSHQISSKCVLYLGQKIQNWPPMTHVTVSETD